MSTVRFTGEVLPDGTIRLPPHVKLAPGQAEVTVEQDATGKKRSGWPVGYFDETAGKFAGEEFQRPDQGELPQRDSW
ncbi:MAG: hypothetical protein WBF93_18375 [Pirellulales bacterium]|nr:hypothetical protein [Pirellulales bacterium]